MPEPTPKPPKVTIKIEGIENLHDSLLEAAKAILEMKAPNLELATTIEDRARLYAPVLTGALEASITSKATPEDAVVMSDVEYAPVIHNGWPDHNIAPNPFLAEAVADEGDQWEPIFREFVMGVIGAVEGV